MFLSSLIEKIFTKEEKNKAGSTLTFGWQCILNYSQEICLQSFGIYYLNELYAYL